MYKVSLPQKKTFFWFFFVCFVLGWIALAFNVVDRWTWILENILVFVGVPVWLYLFKKDILSRASIFFVWIFLSLHSVGAHYTYSRVPYKEWLDILSGGSISLKTERNHFDRWVHFCFGFFMYLPIFEILKSQTRLRVATIPLICFALITSFASFYELMEWGAASFVDPEKGMAFVGAQGDIWDAQKDLALAIVGGFLMYLWVRGFKKPIRKIFNTQQE